MPITFQVTTDNLDPALVERVNVSLKPLHKQIAELLGLSPRVRGHRIRA